MRKIIVIGTALLLLGAGPTSSKPKREVIGNNPPITREAAISTLTNVYHAVDKVKNPDEYKLAADMQNALRVVAQVIAYDRKQIEQMTKHMNWQSEEIKKFDFQAKALTARINLQNEVLNKHGLEKEALELMKTK